MVLVDADHHGPLVNVATWITSLVALILGLLKVFTKWRLNARLQLDDFLVLLAVVFTVASAVAVGFQVASGLGQPQSVLDASQVDAFEKAALATDIFYVLTIYCAKASLIRFGRAFTVGGRRRVALDVLLALVCLWAVVAIISTLLRCPAPRIWDLLAPRCIDLHAFWTFNAVFDILTQITVSILPIILLHDIRMPRRKKRLAICSYLPAATTVPFEILRIVAIWKADFHQDITQSLYWPTLYTSLHTSYSIVASCSTFLIPIIEALSVGLISSEVMTFPKLENPRLRRGEALFNPLSFLQGQRFLATTVVSSEGGTAVRTRGSVNDGRRTVFDNESGTNIDIPALGQLGQLPGSGSQERMVIATENSFEVRSDSIRSGDGLSSI